MYDAQTNFSLWFKSKSKYHNVGQIIYRKEENKYQNIL